MDHPKVSLSTQQKISRKLDEPPQSVLTIIDSVTISSSKVDALTAAVVSVSLFDISEEAPMYAEVPTVSKAIERETKPLTSSNGLK